MKKLTMFACFAKGLAGISSAHLHRLNIFHPDDVMGNYLGFQKILLFIKSFSASHFFSINKINMGPCKREIPVVAGILPWGYIFIK